MGCNSIVHYSWKIRYQPQNKESNSSGSTPLYHHTNISWQPAKCFVICWEDDSLWITKIMILTLWLISIAALKLTSHNSLDVSWKGFSSDKRDGSNMLRPGIGKSNANIKAEYSLGRGSLPDAPLALFLLEVASLPPPLEPADFHVKTLHSIWIPHTCIFLAKRLRTGPFQPFS